MATARPAFISYSRRDVKQAKQLQSALQKEGVKTWRDATHIKPGAVWSDSLEGALRRAGALIVLISRSSARSKWVVFEYAFATARDLPVIGVLLGAAKPPAPLARYQMVKGLDVGAIARGLSGHKRPQHSQSASTPRLFAKFAETDGEVEWADGGESVCLELWVEGAPGRTKSISFEILDRGFVDEAWTSHKTRGARRFLTVDMNSWGDVRIWMRGKTGRTESWATTTSLHDALRRYYRGRRLRSDEREAMEQIRDN